MMNTQVKIQGQVEKVNGRELSYSHFVERYLSNNQPVVLTCLMDDWKACKDWVTHDGSPNLHFFSAHFANSNVQVADCGTREFTDQKRIEMSVSEFINHWFEISSEEDCKGKPLLYLKDWHFVKEYPDYKAYRTPLFFCDDWLNLYLDQYRMHKDPDNYHDSDEISCSDYRFVYMGAKGTWTPLHADVFRSYSWSANVCGKKRWLFLSPCQCHLVFDRNLRSCVYNIFEDVSGEKFPGFRKTLWLECIQEQNEIIFVPSGWYHQVLNLEDTVSINHNWFNAYNLSWVWDVLLRDYKEAKEYIDDIRDICDDFEGLCQRNLAANTGMNFLDFFIFLARFFLANLVLLHCQQNDDGNQPESSSNVIQHLAFNLASIRRIASKMQSAGGVTGNCGLSLDVKDTINDPNFHKLCMDLGRTYGMIHKWQNLSFDPKKAILVELLDNKFHSCSFDGFVRLIDHALVNFRELCSEEIVPASE